MMNLLQPVFIVGSPRSGTSLLRLLLTTNSELVIPPESGFIVWLHQKYRSWSLDSTLDAPCRNRFLDELFACRKFDTWEIERSALEEVLVEHRPEDYAALCAAVYLAFAIKQGKRPLIWGDKNNFYIAHLPLLNAIYPQARFLHIIRDGRDVACSYREVMQIASSSPYAPHLPTDINEIAQEWYTNVRQVENGLSGVPVSRQLTIRYEDLVHDPAAVLADVCHWLGLPFEDKMLAAHEVNLRMQLEPALTLDWKRRTLEPVSPDTVGRYRELLSAGEIASFDSLAGDTLKKYGYVSDDVFEKG